MVTFNRDWYEKTLESVISMMSEKPTKIVSTSANDSDDRWIVPGMGTTD